MTWDLNFKAELLVDTMLEMKEAKEDARRYMQGIHPYHEKNDHALRVEAKTRLIRKRDRTTMSHVKAINEQ